MSYFKIPLYMNYLEKAILVKQLGMLDDFHDKLKYFVSCSNPFIVPGSAAANIFMGGLYSSISISCCLAQLFMAACFGSIS